MQPPGPDDEDAYVFVDHRSEEEALVGWISERLAPEDALAARADGEQLFVGYRGAEHRIPLTLSPHDRYVAISSLAEVLKERYSFFVLVPSLESDTHGILVAPVAAAERWDPLPDHLYPLDLGYDYFGNIHVPWLGHEDEAPNFAEESARMREGSDAFANLLMSALFSGKTSEAEIRKAFSETLQAPELKEARKGMDDAMAELRALTGAGRKPWWKLW